MMSDKLQQALENPVWKSHQIGDLYTIPKMGKRGDDGWNLAYYPILGTHKGESKEYVEYDEPRALVEKPMPDGTDFREIPISFLTKQHPAPTPPRHLE